jgi:benzylsuccinate CoA-transferase BbsF subunit
MARAPLAGVRIVDFTWAWAGPQATLLLGFLGAEVIKVESRRRLDHTRMRSLMAGPTVTGPDQSTIFADLNANKLSVTLDLKQPRAVEIAKDLVRISDVVTQNMRPGVMDKLGLGYEALKAVKPDVIMLSSSAVGSSGPERSYVGYAPTFAAMGGISHITGLKDGPPQPLSGAIDLRVGTTSAFAVLAALYHRKRTGRGQHIDLSSTEAVSALIGHVFMEYAMNGHVPGRAGNGDESMAPHNCYPCGDDGRWVSIAVGSEDEWRALCRVVGDERLVRDGRFADVSSRWRHQQELDEIIGGWTRDRSAAEVTEVLQKAGVPAMPVLDGLSLARDPHLRERGMIVEVDHAALGRRRMLGAPWKYSKTPTEVRPAPLLGEHNRYVLGELLGMSEEEIERLVEEGVVC